MVNNPFSGLRWIVSEVFLLAPLTSISLLYTMLRDKDRNAAIIKDLIGVYHPLVSQYACSADSTRSTNTGLALSYLNASLSS